MSYGAPGKGRYITIYSQPVTRVHGRARPPLRHVGRRRRRVALAVGPALVSGLHGAASSWSLTSIADAQALFEAEGTYLNTASYGLPPRTAFDALQQALGDWRARTHELGGLERGGRPRPRGVRPPGRRRSRARDGRRVGLGARRAGGRVAAGRHAGRGPGDRVHLGALPVHGPARPRGHDRAARAARRGDRRDGRRRRLQRRADVDRRARRPRRDPRRRGRARRAHGRRREPGGGLAAARRDALRLPRRHRLQVAALAARDGVDDGRARAPRRDRPGQRELVRERRALRRVHRAAAAADLRRAPARPLPRLVLVGRLGAGAGAAQRGRRRGDPRARRGAGEPLPRGRWGWSRATPRS